MKKHRHVIDTEMLHLLDTLCQFVLLDVTLQAQLEEMNSESESDGPDGDAGKVPSVILTALTCCWVPGSPGCASTPSRPSDPNTTRHESRE